MVLNPFFIENLSESEIGYIIGLFKGDGYSYHDKKSRHYVTEFYLHSERNMDILFYLKYLLAKTKTNHSVMKDKRFKCLRLKINQKAFMDFVRSNYYSDNHGFMKGFVSGIIDSEGYVNLKKSTITITNTDISLLNTCREYLRALGIRCAMKERVKSKKDKQKSYIIWIPVNFISLNTNSVKENRHKQSRHSAGIVCHKDTRP